MAPLMNQNPSIHRRCIVTLGVWCLRMGLGGLNEHNWLLFAGSTTTTGGDWPQRHLTICHHDAVSGHLETKTFLHLSNLCTRLHHRQGPQVTFCIGSSIYVMRCSGIAFR